MVDIIMSGIMHLLLMNMIMPKVWNILPLLNSMSDIMHALLINAIATRF